MHTSDAGRKFIESWEGLRLHAYDDGTGVLTIGFGHTSAAGPPHVYLGMTITVALADQILASDLTAVELDVNHLVKVPVNQNQYDALVSFDFNTGALGRSNVLRSVNFNRFGEVPADLMMWIHGGGRVMQGLVNRRRAELALFMKPMAAYRPEEVTP